MNLTLFFSQLNIRSIWRIFWDIQNWWFALCNNMYMRRGTVKLRFCNGIAMYSRGAKNDFFGIYEVFLKHDYDPNIAGLTFDWEKSETIIDVGANIGSFSVYASHKAPQATIHAFEPEPENRKILRQNVALNTMQSAISISDRALGDRNTTTSLFVSSQYSMAHSLIAKSNCDQKIEIELQTLESYFNERQISTCDLIKVDCEGSEYEIFYSMNLGVLRSIRVAIVECHNFEKSDTHSQAVLEAFFRQNGFTVRSVGILIYAQNTDVCEWQPRT